MIDAYALSLAALVLTAGSLADRLGRRRVFAAGLGIFTVASLLCALAPDPPFLNLARALQGDRRRGDVRGLARPDRAGVHARTRARHRDGHLRRRRSASPSRSARSSAAR